MAPKVEPSPETAKRIELIQHMTGAVPTNRKSKHGFRNHFCASIGGSDYLLLIQMAADDLVVIGQEINNSTMRYFHATESGCKFAGLSKAATKRALSDD